MGFIKIILQFVCSNTLSLDDQIVLLWQLINKRNSSDVGLCSQQNQEEEEWHE